MNFRILTTVSNAKRRTVTLTIRPWHYASFDPLFPTDADLMVILPDSIYAALNLAPGQWITIANPETPPREPARLDRRRQA